MGFIITFLSGFSTMIGIIFIKFKEKYISFFISFSATIMVGVSFFDLLPSAYNYISDFKLLYMTIFFFLGSVLSLILSKIIPNNGIYKTGILTMIAIFIHNLPEGIITYLVTFKNLELGLNLAISIALHNIPEGIAIAIPIYIATKNKIKACIYPFIASIAEPAGALFAHFFIGTISNNIMGCLFSLTAGIMSYIAIYEMFPNTLSNKNNCILGIISGIILLIIKIYLFD